MINYAGSEEQRMTINMNLDYKVAFLPENFLFGVAYAPYLSEGGYNSPDGIKNNLATLELTGKTEKSKQACRFWDTYEDHIKLAKSLGLNAFRMGVEWTRVQPTTSLDPHAPPEWDWDAVDHYAEIIATLIRNDLEPVITLHHFTHPAWLESDMWTGNTGPDLFIKYATRIVEELNNRLLGEVDRVIRVFVTTNEANLYPLAYLFLYRPHQILKKTRSAQKAVDNLIWSSTNVYDNICDMYLERGWRTPHVSFNLANSCYYEMDKMLYDVLRLREFGVAKEGAYRKLKVFKKSWEMRMDALALSQLNKAEYRRYKLVQRLVGFLLSPRIMKRTLSHVYESDRAKKMDYIGLDIYEPFILSRRNNEGKTLSWDELTMDEDVYETFIRAHHDHNDTNLPIFMIENTLSYAQPIGEAAIPRPDGWTREKFFKRYMPRMFDCMADGIPIEGYLYWSLVDDYEWSTFEPRMGLYNYDYIKGEIQETDGLGEPAGEIYAHLIATLRSGDKARIEEAFRLN
jgi:beta-glucosidase